MKTRIILSILALSGFASAATYTYSTNWNVAVSTTFNASPSETSGIATSTALGTITLPYFDEPGQTLTGVSITYSAPQPTVSDTIVGTVSSSSGTTLTGGDGANFLSATTSITSSNLNSALNGLGNYTNQFATNSFSNNVTQNLTTDGHDLTVTAGIPLSYNLSRDYSTTQFTSTNAAVLAALTKSGTFGFKVTSAIEADYQQSALNNLQFGFTGPDSGTITVTYTSVPEPATPLLGLIPVTLFVLRRRR